jgi:3-oxoacyl-[acyl-carrier-protein] synthase II
MMSAMRDKQGRPLVAVTGVGVFTSVGQGREDTWAALTAGRSGIRRISRFPVEGLRTTIAGTIDSIDVDPLVAPLLSERLAMLAAEEAITQSGIGAKGQFPGALFIAVPPVEMEWPQREALAEASGANGESVSYADLLKGAGTGRFKDWHDLFLSAPWPTGWPTASARRARRFALDSRCSSRATIQSGVEAIGEPCVPKRSATRSATVPTETGRANP